MLFLTLEFKQTTFAHVLKAEFRKIVLMVVLLEE